MTLSHFIRSVSRHACQLITIVVRTATTTTTVAILSAVINAKAGIRHQVVVVVVVRLGEVKGNRRRLPMLLMLLR